MARPEDFWNRIYTAFLPGEILFGQRSQDLYCEREHSPFETIRSDFRPGLALPRPPIAYFTGHRGSGKSSMLLRLLESFRDDYFIVYFDIEHNLDSGKANQIDLLYLLGATVFQVAVQEGLSPDPQLLRELDDSIQTILTRHENRPRKESVDVVQLASKLICIGSGAFGGKVAEKTAEKLTKALLDPFDFSSGVSKKIVRQREVEPHVRNVVNKVNVLIAEVRTKAKRDVLAVVDGLDKLGRPDQARLIFLESNALRGPLCHIIYTVPISIYMDLAFGQAEQECLSYLLPNIKTYEKTSGRKYRRGHETLREVAAKRLDSIDLSIEELFEPEAVDLLIRKCGGVMRWLIELIRDASTEAYNLKSDKIDREAVKKAVWRHAGRLAFRLDSEHREALRQIREKKALVGGETTAQLLQSLMVVAYFNGGPWFDAHPLIWEALEE